MSILYPNVSQPVVFNVSSQINIQLDNFMRTFCIISQGATNIEINTIQNVSPTTLSSILKETDPATATEFSKSIQGYFNYSGNRSVNVLELGQVSETTTLQTQATQLDTIIKSGLHRSYMYLIPTSFYIENSPIVSIMQEYTKETSAQYFMISTTADVTTDAVATQFKNLKSCFLVYDNSDTSQNINLAGSILGILASSKFDISGNNKASPLNFKILQGFKFNPINRVLLNKLTQYPANFIFNEVGYATIGNGRYTNGDAWDYWYQWDLTQLALQQKITQLLINGVNNPVNVIRFDQQGIDIINASVKSTLSEYIQLGCINTYAMALNPANNTLIGLNNINTIDFNTYISQYPDKYQNEIYDGISFYVLINRYIRQCILNITLN